MRKCIFINIIVIVIVNEKLIKHVNLKQVKPTHSLASPFPET